MNTQQIIPVLARGTEDYVSLIFPTLPHDLSGQYATAWDRYSGHGSCSKQWSMEQENVPDFVAQETLANYAQSYGADVTLYRLVTQWEPSYDSERRREAREYQSV
jgi:hypothetical protein